MDCSCSSFSTRQSNFDYDWVATLPLFKTPCKIYVYLYSYLDSIAQWSCVQFQPILPITNSFAYKYLALLIFCERSLWEEKKANFLFKSGFCCYLGIAFTTLGNFPVLTARIKPRKNMHLLMRRPTIAKRNNNKRAGHYARKLKLTG